MKWLVTKTLLPSCPGEHGMSENKSEGTCSDVPKIKVTVTKSLIIILVVIMTKFSTNCADSSVLLV